MIPLITMLAGQAVSNQKTRAWGRGIVSFETVNLCEPFLEQPSAVVNRIFHRNLAIPTILPVKIHINSLLG